MKQKHYEDMADRGVLSASGGFLGPVSRLQQLLEEPDVNQKEVVLYVVHAAHIQPATVMPLLMMMLQQEEASVWQKVAVYRSLRAMAEHGLEVEPIHDFIKVASKQLRASPEKETSHELQLAASNTLATLAYHHLNAIMTELQRQLRPFVQPDEFVLVTLGKIAATNVYGFVPFLGITLTTLQTATRWIEDGRRRQALCTALGQMCEAIRIYLRSWQRSSYPRISVQQFSNYLYPLYTCITQAWLPDSDTQVKVAILKVLSSMLSILLPRKEFHAQIYDDISLFLAQYEISIEAFHITKILGQIVEASLMTGSPISPVHVGPLIAALSHQFCARGQRQHPCDRSRENHAEISRIFLLLARTCPCKLLQFFQAKLEESEEDVCVAILVLLSRIVDAQLPELWNKRQLCVKAIKVVLGDDRSKVRLAVLQAIGKMLRTGYLDKVEGWPLNYISLQLAMSATRLGHPMLNLPLGGLEEKVIQRTSMDTFLVAVATGRGTSQELWAKLLGYLIQPYSADCATSLCHTVRLLAEQRLKQAVHKQVTLEADLPTPQELLTRLLTLAVSPFEGPGCGPAALLLLNALRPEVYQDLAEHWWVEVPAMVHYLEERGKYTLEQSAWEHRLLEFLKKSLCQNPERAWSLQLGQELARQLSGSHIASTEKAFLYKALGTALSTAGDAEGVTLQLQDLLLRADYTDEAQREGVRCCLAYCADGQLTAALRALACFEEEMAEGEDSAHLQASQRLPQPERSKVKSVLLLLYSGTMIHAPQQELLPQLAGDIVPKILHHYATGKPEGVRDIDLALCFTQCVSELSLSILNCEDTAAFQLPHKRVLLDRLLDIFKAEPADALLSPVCQQVMVALRHLSKVPEVLSHEENWKLAEHCLGHIFAMPPQVFLEDAAQALYSGAMASLTELVETLLEDSGNPSPEWPWELFQLLRFWLVSEWEWERGRAMQLGAHLLRSCQKRIATSPKFPLSRLAGVLGPFTCDTLDTIRCGAANCIRSLLSMPGHAVPQASKNRRVQEWRLQCIQQDLQSESTREVHAASLHLAKVVSHALPSQDIMAFTHSLLEQLGTVNMACDKGAILWFGTVARECAPDLRDKVCDIVAVICANLQQSEEPAQHLLLARTIRALAQNHHKAVCASLLKQTLLQDRVRNELWAALVTHEENCVPILKYLLGQLNMEGTSKSHNCALVLAALHWVIIGLHSPAKLLPLLPKLCHLLLCQLGGQQQNATSVLERPGDLGTGLHRLAAAVLQTVFTKVLPEIARELDEEKAWTFLAQPDTYLQGIGQLARALLRSGDPLLEGLLRRLFPSLSSSGAACGELSLAFCAELPGHPLLRKPEILSGFLQQLLAKSHDENAGVRLLGVRGLGNLAEEAPQEVKKCQKVVVASLLQASGDTTNPDVAAESLRALGKLWGSLGRRHVACTLQVVASQARACLQHVDDALRAAAFELFGQLAKAAQPKCTKPFAKEAREAVAVLLLHFRDPSPIAAKACHAAFISCAPFLGLSALTGDLNDATLLTGGSSMQHSFLMDRVCRELARTDPALLDSLIAEVPRSLHCTWEGIQLAACKLAGILMENVETLHLEQLDLEPLLQSLCSLNGDPCATVEIAASEAVAIWQKRQTEQKRSCSGAANECRNRTLFCGLFCSWR